MSRASVVGLVGFVGFGLLLAGTAQAATDCSFSFGRRTMALGNDCTTDTTIAVPDGFTLDGRNHTITAVDPPASNGFKGAIVRNAGARASVHNLRIDTANLITACDPGEDKLRGISLVGASGFVVDNVVRNVNQQGGDGCQEGTGIEAESLAGASTEVRIEGNVVEAYQKNGIRVSGDVRALVRDNVVTGFGPVVFIAQIGILISAGADVAVIDNEVTGNSYTGPQTVQGIGILVFGGPVVFTTGTVIVRNEVRENDDGVFLDNVASAAGTPPETPTDVLVLDNRISKASLTNGTGTQVGILDVGNRDRIIGNRISGEGYDPDANPGAFTVGIFAQAPFAVDPILRRNRTPR